MKEQGTMGGPQKEGNWPKTGRTGTCRGENTNIVNKKQQIFTKINLNREHKKPYMHQFTSHMGCEN